MLATALSISAFGLWIMQSATKNYAGNLYGHQLMYVAAGTVGMLAVAAVPPALMRRVRWPLYAFVLLSTAAVLAVGTSIGGGRRWINLGAFQFQPSEFAKLLLIVGLAAVLAARRGVTGPARLTLLAIGYVGLPALLVFKEPDFGTMLVFLAIMLGMLFVYGIPWQHFVWMILAVCVMRRLPRESRSTGWPSTTSIPPTRSWGMCSPRADWSTITGRMLRGGPPALSSR